MKILHIVMKVLFILVLLMPVLGTAGVFPAPTAELYTANGWAFISALMQSGYMFPLIGLTCAATLILLFMNKTALAAVIIAPMTVNVMAFHWFVDKGPFDPSGILGYVLLVCNAYFLWVNRAKYRALWA